jgi:glutamine amidotransferase PdxT
MNAEFISPLLSPEHIAMVDKGVSTIVGSCGANMRPSVMRALGSSITPGGESVTVYLSCKQSGQLLLDVAATGRIAVVFSEPFSHRTLQVKAAKARIRAAQASDEALLLRYLAAMEGGIARVGFEARFTRAMLAVNLEDVVAISFEPEEAYDQTPGPKAGTALPAGEGRA